MRSGVCGANSRNVDPVAQTVSLAKGRAVVKGREIPWFINRRFESGG